MRVAVPSIAAPILEVFASIQGEGLYIGEPQVFLRLGGCPLRCRWCDTPASWSIPPREADLQARAPSAGASAAARMPSQIEGPDAPASETRANPRRWLQPADVADLVRAAEAGAPVQTVSLTGGEPLAWPAFIRAVLPSLAPRRAHLETSGLFPRGLERVLEHIDHVSLDLKLERDLEPAVPLGAGFEPPPESPAELARARRACLELVSEHDACAKLVVAAGREAADYLHLLDDLRRLAPRVPLIVQPATAVRGVQSPPPTLLIDLARQARERGLLVRVLPQMHRVLGLP